MTPTTQPPNQHQHHQLFSFLHKSNCIKVLKPSKHDTGLMESGVPVCNTCGEHVGDVNGGEVFVACHECHFPICKTCVGYEIKEGRDACSQCGKLYDESPAVTNAQKKAPDTRSFHNGISPQQLSELHDEYGNIIWKNRVESWKEKKSVSSSKTKPEAQIPPGQQMEEIQSAEVSEPLSKVIPIAPNKHTYRIVIIMIYAAGHSGIFLPLQSDESR